MLDLQQPVPAPVRRRVRTRVRSALVTALSAFVVLAAVAYVLAPADASVRLRVDETTTAQPYDAVAMPRYTLASVKKAPRKKRPAYTEIVYGKVDARGVPVSRIYLQLRGAERKTRRHGVTIPIRRTNVAYRTVLHLVPGKYRFTLSLRVGNHTRSASVTRLVRNKHYYRFSAIVRPSGIITLLPVTSY